jgi:hypothetical protein
MEHKEVSIFICDDCMEIMDMDDLNVNSRRIYRRQLVYYMSAIVTILFMTGLCIWSYIVIMEVESMPDRE